MRVRNTAVVVLLSFMFSSPALSQGAAERHSVAHQCQSVIDGRTEQVEFSTWTENNRELPIDGIIAKPDGKGPFPAIVLLGLEAFARRGAINHHSSGLWTGVTLPFLSIATAPHAGAGIVSLIRLSMPTRAASFYRLFPMLMGDELALSAGRGVGAQRWPR